VVDPLDMDIAGMGAMGAAHDVVCAYDHARQGKPAYFGARKALVAHCDSPLLAVYRTAQNLYANIQVLSVQEAAGLSPRRT